MATSTKQNICATSYNVGFNMKKKFILFILIFVFSCQPIEKIDQVVFDNNQLVAFSFNSVKTDILYIHALFISEEYRSTGLSHKMMTEMNSIMKSLNLNKIGFEEFKGLCIFQIES